MRFPDLSNFECLPSKAGGLRFVLDSLWRQPPASIFVLCSKSNRTALLYFALEAYDNSYFSVLVFARIRSR
jgi:hypothetical protein